MKATLIPPATIEGDAFPTCSIIEKAEYKPRTADSKPTIKNLRFLLSFVFLSRKSYNNTY